MDTSKPQPSKQLKEHLQQDQEPFLLQSYLIERSYMFKNCNSDCSSTTHSHSLYSTKNLKWIKYDLQKIRRRFLHATGILRSTLYKFIPTTDDNHDFSSWDEEHNSDGYYVHEIMTNTKATQQTDEPFSLNRFARSRHFIDIEVEDKALPYENHRSALENMFHTFKLPKLRRSEVDTGSKSYWISSNILKFRRAKKCKLEGMVETASLCSRNRRMKKPPFDCSIGKDGEFHKIEGKSFSIKALSEYEHFSLMEKHCREFRKITHLLHTEPFVISEEWKSFQIVNWRILAEIGDSIMDDIVMEIIDDLF